MREGYNWEIYDPIRRNPNTDKEEIIQSFHCEPFFKAEKLHTSTIVKDSLLEEATSPRVFLSGLWGITLGDRGFFFDSVFFSVLLIFTYSLVNFIPQSFQRESLTKILTNNK